MPTPSPSTRLTSDTLAEYLATQPQDLSVYIKDAQGEVIAVSNVVVVSGSYDEEVEGVFFETLRTFLPHGVHGTPEVDEGLMERMRTESLARSIESYKGEAVGNQEIVARAAEFYSFLGGE